MKEIFMSRPFQTVSTPPSKVSLISLFKPKHFFRQRICEYAWMILLWYSIYSWKRVDQWYLSLKSVDFSQTANLTLELFSTYSTLWIIEELYFMDLVDRIIMLKDFKRSRSIIIFVDCMIRFTFMMELVTSTMKCGELQLW